MGDPLASIICNCQQSFEERKIANKNAKKSLKIIKDNNLLHNDYEHNTVKIIDIPARKQIKRYTGTNFKPIVVDVLERY